MVTSYPACFIREEKGFSVIFPDLNWLATCGDNLHEAQGMAMDCLAGYIHSELQDGNPIPPPSDPKQINFDEVLDGMEGYSVAFVETISVDVQQYAINHNFSGTSAVAK